MVMKAYVVSLRCGQAYVSWQDRGGGWMGEKRPTMGNYPAVRPSRDTVELCPNTTQTTGSSETVQRKETLSAMHCKDQHLLKMFRLI